MLKDGRILHLVDKDAPAQPKGFSRIYDPARGKWRTANIPAEPRWKSTAVRLLNGNVLLSGGLSEVTSKGPLGSAEVFDATGSNWVSAGGFSPGRLGHTATVLKDGRVLLAGGMLQVHGPFLNDSWVFDPESLGWSSAGFMEQPAVNHSATLMSDGTVFVLGGRNVGHGEGLKEAEVFDPKLGAWVRIAHLPSEPRGDHAAVLLKNGKVLVMGGTRAPGYVQDDVKEEQLLYKAELYDPKEQTFRLISNRNVPRLSGTALGLDNGKVLFGGGRAFPGEADPLSGLVAMDGRAPWQVFDSRSERWTNLPPTPEGVGDSPSLVLLKGSKCGRDCGKVLVFGSPSAARPKATPKMFLLSLN